MQNVLLRLLNIKFNAFGLVLLLQKEEQEMEIEERVRGWKNGKK